MAFTGHIPLVHASHEKNHQAFHSPKGVTILALFPPFPHSCLLNPFQLFNIYAFTSGGIYFALINQDQGQRPVLTKRGRCGRHLKKEVL
jgi:hypothetical protein